MSKTNFIIIMTDQQNASLRKSEKYPLDTMPFLDSIGENAVDFATAYTPCPACLPARACMFTGRYSTATKIKSNTQDYNEKYFEDILDVFHNNGYETALCGKNHTYRKESEFSYAKGVGHTGGNPRNNLEKDFDDYLKTLSFVMDKNPAPFPVECQLPYRSVDYALDFIKKCNKEKPYFVFLSFAEPHNPYQVCEPYYSMFPPKDLPKNNANGDESIEKGYKYKFNLDIWKELAQRYNMPLQDFIDRQKSNYLGMLRLIDDQVKRLHTSLDEMGELENTHIVFVSDHGDFVGEYDTMRKGPGLNEALCKIPFVWTGPNVKKQGKRHDCAVSLVDILPTFCDYMGVEIPYGVQGKSIRDLLEGKEVPEGEFDVGYSEVGYGGLDWNLDEDTGLTLSAEGAMAERNVMRKVGYDCLNTWTHCGFRRMVRYKNFKLECDVNGESYLYDLEKDPSEINNLYNNKDYQEIKIDLQKKLAIQMLRTTDTLPYPIKGNILKSHQKNYWCDKEYKAKIEQTPEIKTLGYKFT